MHKPNVSNRSKFIRFQNLDYIRNRPHVGHLDDIRRLKLHHFLVVEDVHRLVDVVALYCNKLVRSRHRKSFVQSDTNRLLR